MLSSLVPKKLKTVLADLYNKGSLFYKRKRLINSLKWILHQMFLTN